MRERIQKEIKKEARNPRRQFRALASFSGFEARPRRGYKKVILFASIVFLAGKNRKEPDRYIAAAECDADAIAGTTNDNTTTTFTANNASELALALKLEISHTVPP